MKLRVISYDCAVLPDAHPNIKQHLFDLKVGEYNVDGFSFEIIKINKDETDFVSSIIIKTKSFLPTDDLITLHYAFPITLERRLEGTGARYSFELL